jgi:Zn finger protein HypA/HybF involved in hydrogenase expression
MKSSKYTFDQMKKAIDNSECIKDVIVNLGLNINPGTYRIVGFYAKMHGLELPRVASDFFTQNANSRNKISNIDYFAKDTHRQGSELKKRLIRDYNFNDKCSACGIEKEWNGKPLTLQVDHIDGDRFNNVISNLRFLCPNCHSQTITYSRCGIQTKYKKYNYCECGKRIYKKSIKCRDCNLGSQKGIPTNRTKIEWPPDDVLISMIVNSNFYALSKELYVTDNAIRKRIKIHGLSDRLRLALESKEKQLKG